MRYSFIGLLTFLFLVGCSSEGLNNYTVGDDFIDTNIQVREIDTFTIKAGTFQLDSIITSQTGRILLGNVQDDYLGNYTSQSFFQVQASSFSIDDEAVYDSIGFALSYDGYYYADTTATQKIEIFKIDEEFESKNDDDSDFYNTSTLKLEQDDLEVPISYGELEFIPSTLRDTLYIPMDETLGKDIFEAILNEDISTTAEFIDVYKGFSIKPDESEAYKNNSMLGFDFTTTSGSTDNSAMRIYYTLQNDDNIEAISSYLEFNISSTSNQFNKISTDLTNANINGFEDEETTIYSDESNGLFFAQAGTGISSKIEIPHIRKLSELAEFGTSLSAELLLFPLKGSYDDDKPLPNSLNVYIIDHKNRFISVLTNADGNTTSAFLNQDTSGVVNEVYYSIDLNGFVSQIVGATENLNYSIMLEVPESSNSVNRVVFEKSEDVKLTVTYLNY